MNLSKKKIIKNLVKKSLISNNDASSLLELLLKIIKSKSKSKSVKISSFGTFSYKKTSKRVGRNPKTLDSYIIPEINKLNFKPSEKIKRKIN
jgi:integration host factor subunit alpha